MKRAVKKLQVLGLAMAALLTLATYSHAMMNGGGSMMQMPTGRQMNTYGAVADPVMGTDLFSAMPIGVGSVALGGNMLTLHAAVGQFSNAMDVYFAMYAPAIDPFNTYMVHQDGTIQPASFGIIPWMQGVTGVDQVLMSNLPTSSLPRGTYTFGLMATPSGSNMSTYYLWMTNVVIQ